MASFTAACVQLRTGRSPEANLADTEALIRQAAAQGASYVQTPEMTNLLERERATLLQAIRTEEDDASLQRFRQAARETGIHLHIGSMAIRVAAEEVVNRGYLIGPDGAIRARYDKIHMFDVDLANGQSWRESRTYRPGTSAVTADLPMARLGLSICYDLRFPQLYRSLARAGASVLAVPSAFTKHTGEAHWQVLIRARAIENGAFVIAAAQGGHHEDGRDTFGHSMIVDPWGKVLAEAGTEPGIILAEIDPAESDKVRRSIPSLANERAFADPPQPAAADVRVA